VISRNSTPIFFLLDPYPNIKLYEKVHETKGKKRSNLTAKKIKEDQKISIIEM
jgi:hypothetical protein